MVYKKYIKRGGKVFGPYYYESYRDGDKVKKKYFGTKLQKKKSITVHFSYIALGLFLLSILFSGVFLFSPIGNVVLDFFGYKGGDYKFVYLQSGSPSPSISSSPSSSPSLGASLSSSPSPSPPKSVLCGDIPGDANNDGIIDISDAIAIGKRTWICKENSDVNSDGVVNVADSVYLLNYLFSEGPAPGDGDGIIGEPMEGGEPCVPNYECSAWSECENGFSRRACVDLNECSNNIDKPDEIKICGISFEEREEASPTPITFSPGKEDKEGVEEESQFIEEEKICIPNVKCSVLTECAYYDKVENVLIGSIRFYGLRKRFCGDLNKCIESYEESFPCESVVTIDVSSGPLLSPGEGLCEDNFLTLLKDNFPVAYINLISWQEKNNFEIRFIQGIADHCDFCYDGVKNEGEEGIDCGGLCKDCKLEKKSYLQPFILVLLVIIVVLFVLLVFRTLSWKYEVGQ